MRCFGGTTILGNTHFINFITKVPRLCRVPHLNVKCHHHSSVLQRSGKNHGKSLLPHLDPHPMPHLVGFGSWTINTPGPRWCIFFANSKYKEFYKKDRPILKTKMTLENSPFSIGLDTSSFMVDLTHCHVSLRVGIY